jgi:hypothetical protein
MQNTTANKIQQRLPLVLVLAFAALAVLPACRTVAVNDKTTGELKLGELQVFADHDFETVYQAAKRGLVDLKLFQTGDDKKYIEAELTARDSTDTYIVVKIKEVAKDRCSVKVRYGLTGDTVNAQRLYNAIEKNY